MFFRREKPPVVTFEDHLKTLESKGFRVARKGSGKAVAVRDVFAAIVEDGPSLGVSGKVVGQEIGELVHGGFQVWFQTPKGQRAAASADHLKAYHAFLEDLREHLGLVSHYNEGLGTVNGKHLYDRVRDRDAAAH